MTAKKIEVQNGSDDTGKIASLLIAALHAEDEETRYRAARALRERREQEAIPALLAALHDANDGVRWLASEALIHMGAPSVVPLLEAAVTTTAGPSFFEEVGHILRHVQLAEFEGHLAPVIAACEHASSPIEAPVQAERALMAITIPPALQTDR